jgi:hypothetical protein
MNSSPEPSKTTGLITSPGPIVQQVSVADTSGWRLSVLAKRTYRVGDTGQYIVSEQQIPLSTTARASRSHANLLDDDLDLIPGKPKTDVVVLGHAYAHPHRNGLNVTVHVGRHRKSISVTGNRRCGLSRTGGIVISDAEVFERIPATFSYAYGGRDRAAESVRGNPFSALAPYLVGTNVDAGNQSPYLYPRNPCGKGYLIEATRDAVEQCELPNLEDPHDLLTPDRLVVGHPDRWIYMPMPQALGWMNWGWFPRAAFAGLVPEYRLESSPIPEVARGLMPREVLEKTGRNRLPEHVARFGNGAPIDLQLPFLVGDEEIELTHLHPTKKHWRFRLPGRPKRICTDGRNGKLNETTPVLQTVLIEPDENRVTVVWRGSAPALRPYFPEELAKMPLLVEW